MFAQDKKSTPQVILHFWNQGIRSPLEIHKKTNIPIRTIKYNVKKIKDTGSVARKQGSGRPKKITASASKAIGQYLRRDPTASSRKMVPKLAEKGLELSYRTISRHLGGLGYKNNVPVATPMLTDNHKRIRIEWAYAHLNETAFLFQLFRNMV